MQPDARRHEGTKARSGGRETQRRRGFTLVELSIGLVILTLIVGAMAGLTVAVANGWQATESTQAMQISTRQAATQLYRMIRSARYIGLASADGSAGAALTLWRGDPSNLTSTTMHLCEIVVIEHDLSANTLKMYQVPSTAANAQNVYHPSNIDDASDVTSFKTLSPVTSVVLANNVRAAKFKAYNTASATQHQSVEFVLTYSVDGKQRTEYGTAAVRGPLVPG